ncbi:crossover junction endodeoxyribonuclease RuvC [Iodidimonas gelatinilytica]|uniref:Crossover junction endodeoxyribonuclease RuvC n=1 Tax=Iodidimonas gelatinilytica TaxID=1236966 RepID=A0A5A7MSV2_9PROT|nr:crossover junction endodeoxyribonuclease RuvC [Iodidimonas gelatinilytica]GEQ99122.1 crossover junction endodeoxyribonuclease RuvC [Iodidimonas gelatinilytica]GER02006.1 crossover junction endodeoxyribonuclease RuvC [Iodidimonas gelatinilytica]
MRLLGLDPGLQATGWGIIESDGLHLRHVANGTVRSTASLPLSARLVEIHDGLMAVVEQYQPSDAAVEETFVNKNPTSTLKLGQARGVALLVPALKGLLVAEYSPNHIKKSVVGAGHAAKEQIHAMVNVLLPGVAIHGADAADALAVAICHAHNRAGRLAQIKAVESSVAAQSHAGGKRWAGQRIGRRS